MDQGEGGKGRSREGKTMRRGMGRWDMQVGEQYGVRLDRWEGSHITMELGHHVRTGGCFSLWGLGHHGRFCFIFKSRHNLHTVKCTTFQCSSLLPVLTNEGLSGNCSHHQDRVGFHHPQICLASFWLPLPQAPRLATTDLLSVAIVLPECLQNVISMGPCHMYSFELGFHSA